MSRCGRCDQGERRPERRARLTERDGRTALVLDVPVEVCPACGQVWLSMSVAKRLDLLFERLIESGAESAQMHWGSEKATPVLSSLEEEADRVVTVLKAPGRTFEQGRLPAQPGLYAIWVAAPEVAQELRLEDKDGFAISGRPLYVGKAEDSIARRVEKHFSTGQTGHSTVRRSLGALLRLRSRPRSSTIKDPTPKQLRQITANYELEPDDEIELTDWMKRSLLITVCKSEWEPLKEVEKLVARSLQPPLDAERAPLWSGNPWRSTVIDARTRLREAVRETLA